MTAAERMKNSYVRAKDSAGQARGGEEQGSPVEYAEDRVARWAEHSLPPTPSQTIPLLQLSIFSSLS